MTFFGRIMAGEVSVKRVGLFRPNFNYHFFTFYTLFDEFFRENKWFSRLRLNVRNGTLFGEFVFVSNKRF